VSLGSRCCSRSPVGPLCLGGSFIFSLNECLLACHVVIDIFEYPWWNVESAPRYVEWEDMCAICNGWMGGLMKPQYHCRNPTKVVFSFILLSVTPFIL
jgi:hypothetical protein